MDKELIFTDSGPIELARMEICRPLGGLQMWKTMSAV